jgi:predicted kinase
MAWDPPLVVLMCGVAGAGKTTYAQKLEAQGYVRLSIDEEVWERFGRYGVDYDPSLYQERLVSVEPVLTQRLTELIQAGRNVVVDFSFWQRSDRDRYKRLVTEARGQWNLVYLKASPELLRRRLAARNDRFDANAAFPITEPILERFLAGFEEPNGEGETIIISD